MRAARIQAFCVAGAPLHAASPAHPPTHTPTPDPEGTAPAPPSRMFGSRSAFALLSAIGVPAVAGFKCKASPADEVVVSFQGFPERPPPLGDAATYNSQNADNPATWPSSNKAKVVWQRFGGVEAFPYCSHCNGGTGTCNSIGNPGQCVDVPQDGDADSKPYQKVNDGSNNPLDALVIKNAGRSGDSNTPNYDLLVRVAAGQPAYVPGLKADMGGNKRKG